MDSSLDYKVQRTCKCGCGLAFLVNPSSLKQYLNTKHSQHARDQRRKEKHALQPVEVAPSG